MSLRILTVSPTPFYATAGGEFFTRQILSLLRPSATLVICPGDHQWNEPNTFHLNTENVCEAQLLKESQRFSPELVIIVNYNRLSFLRLGVALARSLSPRFFFIPLFHGLEYQVAQIQLTRALIAYLNRKADLVIFNSPAERDKFHRQIGPTNLEIIRPPQVSKISSQQRIKHQNGIFLSLGQNRKRKRLDYLMREHNDFRYKNDIPLVIAGPYTKQLQIPGGEASIKIVGQVSEDQKEELWTHTLAHLSISMHEAFSMVTLEALYRGKLALLHSSAGILTFGPPRNVVITFSDDSEIQKKFDFLYEQRALGRELAPQLVNWLKAVDDLRGAADSQIANLV